jgi:hypothetical protein
MRPLAHVHQCIAVRDVVHDIGLLQHAAVNMPALGGELPVVLL